MESPFKPAVRENVNLLIGLAGGTGSGKTYTAFRLASGMSDGKPFAVIDTEARRALHYADQFKFDYADLNAPFSPERYGDAVLAAANAGYKVIVIDSVSHEHEGDGGLLDMQEQELQRMAGNDYAKRDTCLQASWIKPKREHKRLFVQKVLQVRAHVIFCMRAEDKTELKKVDGKLKMVPKVSLTGLDGWIPICEKRFPFELTASFLLTADRPGIPHPIKLQEQHKAIFPLDKPITEESGKRLAQWASGSGTKTAASQKSSDVGESLQTSHVTDDSPSSISASATAAAPTDESLIKDIETWVKRKKFDAAYDLARGISDENLRDRTKTRIDKAKQYVDAQAEKT